MLDAARIRETPSEPSHVVAIAVYRRRIDLVDDRKGAEELARQLVVGMRHEGCLNVRLKLEEKLIAEVECSERASFVCLGFHQLLHLVQLLLQ